MERRPKMKTWTARTALLITMLGSMLCTIEGTEAEADSAESSPLRFVSFEHVRMDDGIWRPRIRQLVEKTLPHAFKNTDDAQTRLRLCAEFLENGTGEKPRPHRFNTSDLYKVMEGAACMIQAEPNPAIEAEMDRIIDIIARAQKPDGYLYVPHITGSIHVGEMGLRPYSYVIHSHELYNIGHLYEAAVAYARATGKTKLLEVAEKSAQHVNRAFFIGDPDYNDGKPVNQAPGHQEIELGLTKLYLFTGNRLYLDMAKRFLDIRGITFIPDGTGVSSPTYAQQHKPVAEQTEAVGHAVRAAYQYAAMAEVDGLLGTTDYTGALNAIWHDIVDTKMHITGGLGAVHGIEGFGPSFVLPNKDTYLETCAAVGNVLFNMRMFLKYGDARYVDVAEVALLNNCLSGIGLDGTSFFYPNPLEADAGHQLRSGWFGTACCPSNLSRLIPQVSGYMYAATGSDLFCALYGSNESKLALERGRVSIRQTTEYPFDGRVELELKPDQEMPFRLHVRIPTWSGARLVPGELYAYNEPSEPGRISVNGEEITPVMQKGFAVLERTWKAGDRVVLELPMPVKASLCDARVEANRGRVAFSRGPLVLCAEGADNGEPVQRFRVDPSAAVASAEADVFESGVLAGIPRVTLAAFEQAEDELQSSRLVLIPYYAWSNRDQGSMLTWIPVVNEAGS